MRTKSVKLFFRISIILVLALVMGTAGQVLAVPEEKVDVIISFTQKHTSADEDLIRNNGGKVKQTYRIVPAVAASIPKSKLDVLRRNPRIASIDEDVPLQIAGQVLPGGLEKANSTSLNIINKGAGVKVAVLDTGIDLDHPDLKVAGNVSFVDGTVNGDDDNGHGTSVAGIIAALDNGTGVVGVAPEVALYSVKVMDRNGDALMRWVLSGIQWATENGMQVINLSFGSPMNMPDTIITALNNAYRAGIVIVAGAGNGGNAAGDGNNVWSPARYETVIAVGSIDSNNNRYPTSSTGYQLELVAPGVNINSTAMGGSYGYITGTSASAPYAAGVAALLIGSGVTGNAEVRKRMRSSASDIGAAGWDTRYGNGAVNAVTALNFVEPPDKTAPTTQISLSGKTGRNGWYVSDVTVTLSAVDNAGGSGVTQTEFSLDSGMTWNIYASPFAVTTEGRQIPVLARSRDNAGNNEGPPVSVNIKIDKTAPVITEIVNITEVTAETRKGTMVEVQFKGTAEDTVSMVDGPISTELIDEYEVYNQNLGGVFQGNAVVEAWCKNNDKDGRTYTFRFTVYDAAGNSAFADAVVTVLPKSTNKAVKNKASTNK